MAGCGVGLCGESFRRGINNKAAGASARHGMGHSRIIRRCLMGCKFWHCLPILTGHVTFIQKTETFLGEPPLYPVWLSGFQSVPQ